MYFSNRRIRVKNKYKLRKKKQWYFISWKQRTFGRVLELDMLDEIYKS